MRRLPGPVDSRLSEGDQTPQAHFELFRDWQRTQTQSSVRTLLSLRQQMDGRSCRDAGTTSREATTACGRFRSKKWLRLASESGRRVLRLRYAQQGFAPSPVQHAGQFVNACSCGRSAVQCALSQARPGISCFPLTTCMEVGYAKVTHDLTERKNHEDALLANEAVLETEKERLQVTLDSIADGVVCTDEAGNIMLMNPTAENRTGWIQKEGHRQTADHESASIAIVPEEILRSVAIACQRDGTETSRSSALPAPSTTAWLSNRSAARVLSYTAEPERGHIEGDAPPSGGLARNVGFSHGKFCRQSASWSSQMKTRREGGSPLKGGSIVLLDRAW